MTTRAKRISTGHSWCPLSAWSILVYVVAMSLRFGVLPNSGKGRQTKPQPHENSHHGLASSPHVTFLSHWAFAGGQSAHMSSVTLVSNPDQEVYAVGPAAGGSSSGPSHSTTRDMLLNNLDSGQTETSRLKIHAYSVSA